MFRYNISHSIIWRSTIRTFFHGNFDTSTRYLSIVLSTNVVSSWKQKFCEILGRKNNNNLSKQVYLDARLDVSFCWNWNVIKIRSCTTKPFLSSFRNKKVYAWWNNNNTAKYLKIYNIFGLRKQKIFFISSHFDPDPADLLCSKNPKFLEVKKKSIHIFFLLYN